MCMEDVKLGRETATGAKQQTILLGTTAVLAGPNPDRVYIAFSTNSAAGLVGPDMVDITVNGVFVIGPTLPPLLFRVEEYGDLVTKGWNGRALAADVNYLVVEGFLAKR